MSRSGPDSGDTNKPKVHNVPWLAPHLFITHLLSRICSTTSQGITYVFPLITSQARTSWHFGFHWSLRKSRSNYYGNETGYFSCQWFDWLEMVYVLYSRSVLRPRMLPAFLYLSLQLEPAMLTNCQSGRTPVYRDCACDGWPPGFTLSMNPVASAVTVDCSPAQWCSLSRPLLDLDLDNCRHDRGDARF